ncbi:MAG TPA: GFA family protein [Gammaproteobacteria bacterium]|nr:GFA family protein [Gammaproteobacteria bacterium]
MHIGSCLCGAVKYEIDGALGRTYYCHCSRCRKTSGSAFAANAVISPNQFRITEGEDLLASFIASNGANRIFCSRCGSHLAVSQGDQMRLRLGSLDTPLNAPLDMHIFVASKADWHQIFDDLPQYDERPQV